MSRVQDAQKRPWMCGVNPVTPTIQIKKPLIFSEAFHFQKLSNRIFNSEKI
jgi:hypothetical protein